MEPTGPQHAEAIKSWWWGDLQDHLMRCDECNGTGHDDPDDDESDDCYECSGDGDVRWGSYYEQDQGECHHCRRVLEQAGLPVPDPMPEVGIAKMFDSGGHDDKHDWICLRCYVAMHQRVCDCARWREAEMMLGVSGG